MQVSFDFFNQMEKPAIFLCNPNGSKIESIGGIIYDTKLNLKFNALSEFSFKFPKTLDGVNNISFYDKVKIKRQVYIDGIGYFIIVNAVETSSGESPVLDVECLSLESEMLSKKVNVLNGTFRLYNPIQFQIRNVTFTQSSSSISTGSPHTLVIGQAIRFSNINVGNFTSGRDYYIVSSNQSLGSFTVSEAPGGSAVVAGLVTSNGLITPSPTDSLLSYLLSLINMNVTNNLSSLGGWKIGGVINSGLASKYRTFDISDSTVYSVLMNDIAKAYECIFIFDTINKEIIVKTLEEATSNTNIYISYDNLIKSSELKEMSDEIATALYVYGGDGIDIRAVNPTGSNVIYNFEYYKNTDWMSQDLIDAITSWQNKISVNSTVYSTYVQNLITAYNELGVLESQLATLEAEESALEVSLKAAIEINSGVSAANSAYIAKQSQVNNKQNEINSKQSQINTILANLKSINILLDINNASNFTEAQRVELSKYIIENTWQNENIIILDSYTPSQIQQTKLSLYEQALGVLERVSQPRYEFSMDSANFIALKEYEEFTSQIPISLGSVIRIQGHSNPISAVLLEMSLSYDNPTDFSMVFSNRLRLDNAGFQYSDLVGQVVKTGSSVSFDKPSWSNWSSNYKDDVVSFVTSSLNATNNEIINSSNQEISLGAFGLRGRKSNGSGGYEQNEIWLTSNTLAFTDNSWNSTKTALGRINLGGGTFAYGLVADTIIGNLVASANLTISNENNSFIVNATGATLTNAKLTIQSQLGGTGGIILDPNSTNVMSIGSISGGIIASPKFRVDVSGNVSMTGDLFAGSNYIKTDGTAKIGGLTITPTTAVFTGEIIATKLTGSLDWNNITNVPANRIAYGGSSGRLSASGISAGTMLGSIGMANGLLNIYQGGSSVFIDASGSSGLALTGSVGGVGINIDSFIWLNGSVNTSSTITSGGSISTSGNLSANGNITMAGNLVATQSWVNSQGFLKSGSSPSFSLLTITSDINVGGVSGVGTASTPVSITFPDNNGVNHTITVRAGIVTLLT